MDNQEHALTTLIRKAQFDLTVSVLHRPGKLLISNARHLARCERRLHHIRLGWLETVK
jgi:hypothetical protein